jgi:hypothetical protein
MGRGPRFRGKGKDIRLLTGPEERLIKDVFRTARLPRLSQVRIGDGVNASGDPWTDSDYEINVGRYLFDGDVANLDPATLVHEMVHVWQYYSRRVDPRGGMAEWSMAAVLKTAVPGRVPGVRIPLPPPTFANRSLRSRLRLAGRVWRASREGCLAEAAPSAAVTRSAKVAAA